MFIEKYSYETTLKRDINQPIAHPVYINPTCSLRHLQMPWSKASQRKPDCDNCIALRCRNVVIVAILRH